MTFKKHLNIENLIVGISILIIGIGAGSASFLLHESADLLSDLLNTNESFNLTTLGFSVAVLFLGLFLTKKIFKDTGGSGIPHVKLSLTAFNGKMAKRMPAGKFITSLLTLVSGFSLGKEGPLVTISAAIGNLTAYSFKLNRRLTKLLVTSGASAGLAGAFNTPIAAVVFTVEEIWGQLNSKYIPPIMLTAVISSLTSSALLDGKTTFETLNYKFILDWHVVNYILLGLFMSIVGHLFINTILTFEKIENRFFQNKSYLYLFIAVLLTAAFSQITPEVLGDGTKTINFLLQGSEGKELSYYVMLGLMKIILIAYAYSTGVSGGLFMPVLFMGAIGGSVYGSLLSYIYDSPIEIGVFALMGMTSLLVAVIKTPFTAFILLFEMTRDYELILPLMLSSTSAYLISSMFDSKSVYESVADSEGVHLPTASDNEGLDEFCVRECMVREITSLDFESKIKEVKPILELKNHQSYPVLKNGNLEGVVYRNSILSSGNDEDTSISDLIRYRPISIYPDQNLLVALDKMKRFDLGSLPVVSRFNDKIILGIITAGDIIGYFSRKKIESTEPTANP